MPNRKPSGIQKPSTRSPKWHYWIVIPIGSLAYTAFCTIVIVFAWGLRGTSKPWWYRVAQMLALPGMYSPLSIPGVWWSSYLGAPLWGGIMGFGLLLLTHRIRRRPSLPPRL